MADGVGKTMVFEVVNHAKSPGVDTFLGAFVGNDSTEFGDPVFQSLEVKYSVVINELPILILILRPIVL